jgi:quinol monooxygenase YgiN
MKNLEVIARIKIRPGQLEGFKTQAAELLRSTLEKDTKTIRYDWFIDEDAMECEVHEEYLNEEGLMQHNQHVMDARAVLFEKYAFDHQMSLFGEISPQLKALTQRHAEQAHVYSLFRGLEATAKGDGPSRDAR